jgi:hypothetical protein
MVIVAAMRSLVYSFNSCANKFGKRAFLKRSNGFNDTLVILYHYPRRYNVKECERRKKVSVLDINGCEGSSHDNSY